MNGQPTGSGAINISTPSGSTPGCFVVWSIVPNPAAHRVDVNASVNTACVPSIPVVQSGAATFCDSTNGSTAYTCGFGAVSILRQYSVGMTILLRADTANLGACNLNVDNLGAKSIKQANGSTDPAANAILPGHFYPLHFDGTVLRMEF